MSRFGTIYLLACKLTNFNQPCCLINSKFVFICCEFIRVTTTAIPHFEWRQKTTTSSLYGTDSKVRLELSANFHTITIHSYKNKYVVEDWHADICKNIIYETDSYIFEGSKRPQTKSELLANIHFKMQLLLKTKSDLNQIIALVLSVTNNDI